MGVLHDSNWLVKGWYIIIILGALVILGIHHNIIRQLLQYTT